jgi:hypothetical protein
MYTYLDHAIRPEMYCLHIGAKAKVCVALYQEPVTQNAYEDATNNWRQRISHSHTTFLLEDFTIHLKTSGSQTDNNFMMALICKMDLSANV